VDRSSFMKLC